VVCGGSAFYEWLGALAGVPAAAFAAAALSLGWFLIYLDVRQRITGAHPGLVLRTFWVFFVGLVWAVAQISAAAIFTSWIGWRFHWLHAAMVAGPALAVAVLTQFFFTKAGSIGEPL
jgi:hypothetical protein